MRWLAIDLGSKRVGLAISDPAGTIAMPLRTLRVPGGGARELLRAIQRIAAEEGVGGFVLGEPKRLDGSAGEAAERSRRFAARLRAATGLPVELVDEALTSREAAARLRAAGVDPRREPERVDAVAAQILLEEALTRRATGAGRG